MSLFEEFRGRHETAQAAARDMGRGLMRGNREEFKLGYTHENAARVVIEGFGLSPVDAVELRCYLLGFGVGLNEVAPVEFDEAVGRLAGHSERYGTACEEGHEAGRMEAEAGNTYPAGVS